MDNIFDTFSANFRCVTIKMAFCHYIERYCYVCGKYSPKSSILENFSTILSKLYVNLYGVTVKRNQAIPNTCCKSCAKEVRLPIPKTIFPVIWGDPPDQHVAADCYFCVNFPKQGMSTKRRSQLKRTTMKSTKYVEHPDDPEKPRTEVDVSTTPDVATCSQDMAFPSNSVDDVAGFTDREVVASNSNTSPVAGCSYARSPGSAPHSKLTDLSSPVFGLRSPVDMPLFRKRKRCAEETGKFFFSHFIQLANT